MAASLTAKAAPPAQAASASSLTAQAGSLRSTSADMSMRARAERAAQRTASKLRTPQRDEGHAQEYVSAFGAKRELPRTPQRGSH